MANVPSRIEKQYPMQVMRIERQVLFWLAALLVALLIIGALREIMLPFIVGIIVAYALNPIVDRLVNWGATRTLASAIIMAILIALLIVLLTQWALKVGWEVLLTPVTYAVVGFLKRKEGVDIFDERTDFTPFSAKV